MTEHEKLVERLRKVELWFPPQSDMRFVHLAARDAAAALALANARIARLEEALKPFARAAEEENLQADAPDNCMVDYSDGLVVGDLRRARAALKGDA